MTGVEGRPGETQQEAEYREEVADLAARLAATEAERDMYREKAHRFIKGYGQFDAALGALVGGLESLIEAAEGQATMTVGVSALQRLIGRALDPPTAPEPTP